MSARYAPLPNPRTDPDAHNEMEAAFDDSDDEDEQNATESHPLNPSSNAPSHRHTQSNASPPVPGAYDFENFDYASYPPPGSPPGPCDRALPNDYGNSNGLVPEGPATDAGSSRRGGGWFGRAAAVLPTHFVQRLRRQEAASGPVGGGLNNDGVFANVTAKPSRGVRVQDGDQTYVVPEEAQKDAPPSYAAAQADAVPPYWETTVHAPSSPSSAGEIIIDSLPTGSLFSFLWNMLVSISFQFVGFLLTYLLHTTHAARLGSRAGLGVTLIQYGFALRSRNDATYGGGGADSVDVSSGGNGNGWMPPQTAPVPTFSSAVEADEYWKGLSNGTVPVTQDSPQNMMVISDVTTEWLSFFLMTVGWFVLLTSIVGFYRVKLWERNILSSQRESAQPPAPSSQPYLTQIERVFGIQGPGSLFRTGLGLNRNRLDEPDGDALVFEADAEEIQAARERARMMASGEREREMMAGIDPTDPDAVRRVAEAYAQEARLHQELRDAGLL
ncbi:hypothetical protein NEOLEDRAFT_1245943 [Neolentinus lepideus HHB14362 ss-1]|uniref:Metal homeostatis protein bsd2 n=1 Tax=Neolentinus lepideus HHB14362 ss-1 TaxID=1314782 RepID=A0A165N7C2_9AGAM|nr:hypothetical protein NEOLEDRAFT_1245943 [Neolentinus lepideus HHB14362 ss-1]